MRRRLPALLVLVGAGLLALPSIAGQPPIVRLRIDSAEAAARSLGRVGAPIAGASFYTPIAEQLGLRELGWIDDRRPAAVVLPFGGMTAGAAGMVAVLPHAGERDVALGAIGATFDEVSESDGVHRMSRDGGASIALVADGGYFVIGANAALVRQVDAGAALALGDLPPGAAAIEIELEAVAPIIQLGLMQGRQMMQQQMEATGEAAVPAEFIGVYFDGVRDLVSNTSRIQLAFDTAGDRLAVRTRVVPRVGSTLAGVVAAQTGGLPRLLELIDADGAQMLYAGQITFTDAMDEALAGYTDAYTKALADLLPTLQQAGGPGRGGLDAILELLGADAVAEWRACRAGEYAGRMDFDDELQMRMVQLSSLRDADECRQIAGSFSDRLKEIVFDEMPISITPGALTHRGAQAFRIDLDMAGLAAPGSDQTAVEIPAMTQYFGFSGPVAITTLGADGEARFKTAVDRVLDGRKRGVGRAPGAADFAPLEPSAGVMMSMDLGAIAGALPHDEGEPALTLEGRVVAGLRFVGGRIDVDVSMPLSALDALHEMESGEPSAQPAPATGTAR